VFSGTNLKAFAFNFPTTKIYFLDDAVYVHTATLAGVIGPDLTVEFASPALLAVETSGNVIVWSNQNLYRVHVASPNTVDYVASAPPAPNVPMMVRVARDTGHLLVMNANQYIDALDPATGN